MDIVLHRLSVVGGDCCGGERGRGQEILLEAQSYYNAMFRFRKDWERNKRYNYDNQWGRRGVWRGIVERGKRSIAGLGGGRCRLLRLGKSGGALRRIL